MTFILSNFICILLVCFVNGHGRLQHPPGRGTAWRYEFETPRDYNDHSANCGGLRTQSDNDGKCGICGDNYNDETPRAHENGGTYGLGVIVGKYKSGEDIEVKIQLTANHLGYFKFTLCNLSGGTETEECFNPLALADGAERAEVSRGKNDYDLKVKLPNGTTCEQCVFRWTYIAGNNWGGPETAQENFVNCADISVS